MYKHIERLQLSAIYIVAFFIGSFATIYDSIFYILVAVSFFLNLIGNLRAFLSDVYRYRFYLLMPIVFLLIILFHYFCVQVFKVEYFLPYKARWGIFENMLLYFTGLPLYALSLKPFVNVAFLKKWLALFTVGVLFINIGIVCKYYNLAGDISLKEFVNTLYVSRFFGNKEFLGQGIFIDNQAFYLGLATLVMGYLAIESIKLYRRIVCFVLFSMLTVFLSFTVTKGAILGFIVALLFVIVVNFKRIIRHNLIHIALLIGLLSYGSHFIVSNDAYNKRFEQLVKEINNVSNDDFSGDSFAPRVGILKEYYDQIDHFALTGLGVYHRDVTREWFDKSPYNIRMLYHSHNSFLDFWAIGGIYGLIYIILMFALPMYRMFKLRAHSYLITSILIFIFISNNAAILLRRVDSIPIIVVLLACFYFYTDVFIEIRKQRMIEGKE